MKTTLFPAEARGHKNIGWLESRFHISFSDYYNPSCAAFGTLFAFNDDLLQTEKGFGIHPHQNMEIISVLLKGKMNHKDSMGYSTVVEESGVQIMSAGSGLFHEEYNIGQETVNFLQIWILPKQQNIRPRYQIRHFPKAQRKGKLVKIVSFEEGTSHCWINQNAILSLGYYDAGAEIDYTFSPVNKCIFLFLIDGTLKVADAVLNKGDALGIWETDTIQIHTETEAEFLIIETPVNQK